MFCKFNTTKLEHLSTSISNLSSICIFIAVWESFKVVKSEMKHPPVCFPLYFSDPLFQLERAVNSPSLLKIICKTLLFYAHLALQNLKSIMTTLKQKFKSGDYIGYI